MRTARAAAFVHPKERRSNHAVSKRPKRQSGRPPARIAQQDDRAHAKPARGRSRGDRAQGDRNGERRRQARDPRVHGPPRVDPQEDPIAFELPPMDKARDTVAAVAAVVSAVAAGDLTTSEAAEVAKIIDIYVRALATTAFEERLEKLERAADPFARPTASAHGDHAAAAADA